VEDQPKCLRCFWPGSVLLSGFLSRFPPVVLHLQIIAVLAVLGGVVWALGRALQDAERAGNFKSSGSGSDGAGLVIHQQQIGVEFKRKSNGIFLAGIEEGQSGIVGIWRPAKASRARRDRSMPGAPRRPARSSGISRSKCIKVVASSLRLSGRCTGARL
jgi:hypothetical protein